MASAAAFTCGRRLVNGCLFSNVCRNVQPTVFSNAAPGTACTGVRFYKGSFRKTRRSERNIKYQRRIRTPPKPFDKVAFMQRNFQSEVRSFAMRLQLRFKDERILQAALTHPSYLSSDMAKDSDMDVSHNVKLSLLGLQLTSHWVIEMLYFKYPQLPPVGLQRLLEFLISRDTIVKLAEDLSLPELVRTQCPLAEVNSEKHLGYTREDVITDAVFALVGAIHKDQGPLAARSFVYDFITQQLNSEELPHIFNFDNPQEILTNMLNAQGWPQPVARIMHESGKNTKLPVIVVGIFSGDTLIAEGSGWDYKKAIEDAFNEALMKQFELDTRQKPELPSDREFGRLTEELNNLQLNS